MDGSVFCGGGSQFSGEKQRWWRRFKAVLNDSLGKEDKGGKAVLGANSERVGVARNGGSSRRPWRRCWLL
jgi:hypothetical protein